ncbi:MAG: spore coat associated protein CotJA [Eubacteriales bacterium]|nr:spore coat associated protein CotJA [Clostridiales bacterium]
MNRGYTTAGGCRSCGATDRSRGYGCGESGQGGGPSLAMAYVPLQSFTDLYSPEEALRRGTLFRELYMPYGGGSRCRRT